MEFLKVDVQTTSIAMDGITGLLTSLGVTGFILNDAKDLEEFIADKDDSWDYIDDELVNHGGFTPYITFYLQNNIQGKEQLENIKTSLAILKEQDGEYYGSLAIAINNVDEEDWEHNWKQYYKPFEVGDRFIIKPSWEEISPPVGKLVLEIDPASAFGTGQHSTTKLCLEEMENIIHQGDRVLDLGCGSGILSIGAFLLGASHVTLVDIFKNAVDTSTENLEKNNIPSKSFSSYWGDITEDIQLVKEIGTGFQVITANIVADVIISMSKIFPLFLNKAGTLLVSGIIQERAKEVEIALINSGFKVITAKAQDGWSMMVLKQRI